MGESTEIEWTAYTNADGKRIRGFTWSPWWGCVKVSAACTHCYAEEIANHWHPGAGLWRGSHRRMAASTWAKPLAWNRAAAKDGTRPKVFPSMCDPFEDHADLPEWRADFFRLIEQTPHLVWLPLTKRPENILGMVPPSWLTDWPSNVWVGTTVEDQQRADERIPHLLRVPAPVRFLSMEPLLGPVDLHFVDYRNGTHTDALRPSGVQWVIAGGESGPRARPSHPEWFRVLRDQCEDAGVPFHFKQWGEFAEAMPGSDVVRDPDTAEGAARWRPNSIGIAADGRIARSLDDLEEGVLYEHMLRVGKAAAGRLLDGVEHNGVPHAE